MKRKALPAAFKGYRKIGGVLRFAVFEEAEADEASALEAIAAVVPGIDNGVLRSLGYKRIGERAFFGDWYDPKDGALIKLGRYRTGDGREVIDPKLKDLDSAGIVSGAALLSGPGAGGQFAYAFSQTPYGLRAKPSVVQDRFDKVREVILPPELEHDILDWSHPRLPEASSYFAAGAEYWGVFLFTIHVPALRRLTAIAGSTSD